VEPHAPLVGGKEARDEVERRRLPGPVGADEANDSALLDGERGFVDGDESAELLAEVTSLQQDFAGRVPLRRPTHRSCRG